MADKTPFDYSLLKTKFQLFATLSIGSTGAPTLLAWTPPTGASAGSYSNAATTPANSFSPAGAQGIATVAKGTTGIYNFVLQESACRVLAVHQTTINSTGISAAPAVGLITAAQTGFVASSTNKTISVQCSAAGSAAWPASGDVVIFAFDLDLSGSL